MAARSIEELQRYLEQFCDEAAPVDDAALLDRFTATGDCDAFTLLIARHGPMVLGTARRLVENTHDADDVFQAVFLSLARLANRIRRGQALPAWLHQATCRIAAKVRRTRRFRCEETAPEPMEQTDPAAHLVWREVRQALDEELQRLPEQYRSPLLLCYLSGLTRDEAARQLGWSLGTLKRRLAEGRELLRHRLARRGIASVGLALTVLTPESLHAAVSSTLFDSTLRLIVSAHTTVPESIAALALPSTTTTKGLVMKSILALVATIAVGLGIYTGTGPANPPTNNEERPTEVKPAQKEKGVAIDDPLPAGSTLRFGTSRFRHGESIAYMAVSADGKIAVVGAGTLLFGYGATRAFDLESGRVLFHLSTGGTDAVAISHDGRLIVTKASTHSPQFHVFESDTGKVLRSITIPSAQHMPEGDALALSLDGKALATTSNGKDVHLIDMASGQITHTLAHQNPESGLTGTFPQVLAIAFSPDGQWLATGGYANDKDNYFARLWDIKTGNEVRRFMLGRAGYGVRSLAFSPDSKTLATMSTQSGAYLRLFDVDTGKLRHAMPKDGDLRTKPGSVAFSPDGKTVAAAGTALILYDVDTGKERLRINQRAIGPHFIDGGKTLVAAVDGTIHRWDAVTGKTLTPAGGDAGVEQILVTPDGRHVITRDSNGYGHLWDAATGKHLRRFSAAYRRGVALSPDGRYLACPTDDSSAPFEDPGNSHHGQYGSRIRMYDLAANKDLNPFPAFKGEAKDVAFTADGKKLITAEGSGGMVRIWDIATGKEERNFSIRPEDLKEKLFFVRDARLSADGATVLASYEEDNMNKALGGRRGLPRRLARLWDVASGQMLPEPSGGHPLACSPDRRFVVTRGGHVSHLTFGARIATLPGETSIGVACFSPDSRFLATTAGEGIIRIWEVATWTKRSEFQGHRDGVSALAFASSKQLLSGSPDTTVLAWDLQPPRAANLEPLANAWEALAARESSESLRSEGRFLATPADTVKFFTQQVQPGEPLDLKQVERWLSDLDSDEFTVRDTTSTSLAKLGRPAIPYIEATLRGTKSPEVQVRAKKILEKLSGTALTPDQRRQVRAVMILERIGDPASTNLLRTWAAGPAGALLTMETSAALQRLAPHHP